MQISTPIHDFLRNYSDKNPIRCHMPGGKGNNNPFDITEIEGADSLFESSGIIAESEKTAAKLFGAEKTLYSCGGSTLSIQTMLALAKRSNPKKNRVTAGRYCHKSLVSACALLGLEIDWVMPKGYLSCEIEPKKIKEKIGENTLCVFVQSIDYYGGESDIRSIAEVCQESHTPLLVDNAHGAYLVFTDRHPLKLGADMTADSAHKTLPCLTGGSYLHIKKNSPFAEGAKELMSLFGSSSPSYLILDSLDLCNTFVAEGKEQAEKAFEAVKELKSRLLDIGWQLRPSDLMRITADAGSAGYTGFELSEILAEKNIFCEYADDKYTVLLFSSSQELSDFGEIFSAFKEIPRKISVIPREIPAVLPNSAMSPREALFAPSQTVPLDNAEGKICGEIQCSCPPCVPLIMPGEVYSGEIVETLRYYKTERVRVVK